MGKDGAIEDDGDEIKISDEVTDALCDNFDLVNELIRTDPAASSQILQVLLDSIGRLDLNALSNEPTVNKYSIAYSIMFCARINGV